MPSDFDRRFREIARQFLVSAAVVDDEPHFGVAKPDRPLKTPDRTDRTVDDESPAGSRPRHSLDAGVITEAFSKIGLICGVVKQPRDGSVAVEAVRRGFGGDRLATAP